MSLFNKFNDVYPEIETEEDFNSSIFAGSEELLQKTWNNCLVASDYSDGDLSELYYFIEGNAEHIQHMNNMLLCKLSGSEIVLFDDYDNKAIIIHKDEKDNIENFI